MQFDPGKDTKLNIYLVHGLSGNRAMARTAEQNIPWQLHLLQKELPWARIATYGYDAQLLDLHGLAKIMMHEIMMDNDGLEPQVQPLPILLVGYGFGDVVCKQALMYSEEDPEEDMKLLFKNTRALVSRQYMYKDIAQPIHGRIRALLSKTDCTFSYQEIPFKPFAMRNPKLNLIFFNFDKSDDEFYKQLIDIATCQIAEPSLYGQSGLQSLRELASHLEEEKSN